MKKICLIVTLVVLFACVQHEEIQFIDEVTPYWLQDFETLIPDDLTVMNEFCLAYKDLAERERTFAELVRAYPQYRIGLAGDKWSECNFIYDISSNTVHCVLLFPDKKYHLVGIERESN